MGSRLGGEFACMEFACMRCFTSGVFSFSFPALSVLIEWIECCVYLQSREVGGLSADSLHSFLLRD